MSIQGDIFSFISSFLFPINSSTSCCLMSISSAVLISFVLWFILRKFVLGRSKAARNPFSHDCRRTPEPLEKDLKARDKVLKNGFVVKKIPENIDVIIIGSGIGGLSCAAILAKSGKKVLVLEQHDQAGGCCHTFYEKGFEFDTGIHYVGEMSGNSLTKFYVDQLTDGQLTWSALDPQYDEVIIGSHPNNAKRFPIMSGIEEYKNALLKKFPNEQKAIDDYLSTLKKIRGSFTGQVLLRVIPKFLGRFLVWSGIIHWLTSYFKYAQISLHDYLNKITTNKDLQTVLAYAFGDYGTPPKDSSLAMHGLLSNHFIYKGGFYPVGGASEIAMHLIPIIEKSGGRVLVRANVKEILIDERKREVLGVRVAKSSGDVDISCSTVISGAGIYNTFEKLLEAKFVDDDIKSMIDSVRHGPGGLTLFIGLNCSHEEAGLIARNNWIFSNNDLDQSWDSYKNLAIEKVGHEDIPLLFLSFPSTKDPTWNERFPGKSTCEVVSLANYEWFKQWKDEKIMHRGKDYEEIKDRVGKRMWEQVCRFYPHLKDKVAYFDVGSPLSNQYYLSASHGELYGADHNVERFLPQSVVNLRPETSIKGLFLTGQDILVCGFSGGLYSGLLTASAFLERNVMNDLISLKKQCKKKQ